MPTHPTDPVLDGLWAALDGPPEARELARPTGPEPALASRFAVTGAATAAVAAAGLAGSLWAARRSGRPPGPVTVDTREVAVAVRSERQLSRDGEPAPAPFDPLSAFHRCADGWLRLHANYPWHRAAALRALGLPADPEPDRDVVVAALRERRILELEDAVHAAGGVAAAVRAEDTWWAGPGAEVAGTPLVERLEHPGGSGGPGREPVAVPRVLDLTRVIAGPVATRTLAAHGAEVLRLDPPHRPELPWQAYDTLPGKRSALLDLADPDGRATLDRLLTGTDVVVTGYRPGALARFGLDPGELLTRFPGLVVLTLSGWGHVGPWRDRRGFDSLVQAACGIALVEGDDRRPGALPAQVLDHATGYLGAAAMLLALAGGGADSRGGGRHLRLSLARTARWLQSLPRTAEPGTPEPIDPEPYLRRLVAADGTRYTLAAPPGRINGRSLDWPAAPPTYGSDRPEWAARR
jgi:crotonobetainyl-CoA:carnitine CoA-transferase CaiB-like acyl-CoA transferase